MSLDAAFELTLGALRVDVALSVADGEVLALLGPNGSGKTTMLRCLLGLVDIDRGHVEIGGVTCDDSESATWVPTERRSIGMVFQDYLLFEHLTVVDNVAFGLRASGRSRSDARSVASEWLERVGLAAFASDRPAALSGGQRQRVALARALAPDPSALLLDEPLAALDAGTRHEVRRDLRRFLGDFAGPTILVTHDPLDAFALADRAAIIDDGRISQDGSLDELRDRPRSAYAAELLGLNLLRGVAADRQVVLLGGTEVATSASLTAPGAAFVVIRPNAIALHAEPPQGSARNVWQGTIEHLDQRDDRVRARVKVADDLTLLVDVTPQAVRALSLAAGSRVWASCKATEIAVYPA